MPDRVPAEVCWPHEINREYPLPMVLPVLVGHLVYWMCLNDAGIVYEDIDTTHFINGLIDEPLGCVGVCDIAGTEDMTCPGQFGKGGLGGLEVGLVMHRYLCASASKLKCDGAANSPGRAGYQDFLFIKAHRLRVAQVVIREKRVRASFVR